MAYYYDINDKSPRRWALLAIALYAFAVAVLFVSVSFNAGEAVSRIDTILVDFTEIPTPEPPKPPTATVSEPQPHTRIAAVEQTAQVSGRDEVTQTPNPKALFSMNKGGSDEAENAGNPYAPVGEDRASGSGPGLNPFGTDQLDQGLQKRGLVGALPTPDDPGTQRGRVVVRVTVDGAGRVTSAAYEPIGSTTGAAELIEAALEAARKARFAESSAPVVGGNITYIFGWKY